MQNEQQKTQGNNGNKASLGAQAVAAVGQQAKQPDAKQPEDHMALGNAAVDADGDDADADDDETKPGAKRIPKKVFIVIGTIHEFKNTREAEAFLNGEHAPPEFRVLKGNELVRRQKVALG
jgi:hypothetical protein